MTTESFSQPIIPSTPTKNVILICGLPASGKSTLTKALRKEFGDRQDGPLATIEYDHIQESLLAIPADQASPTDDDEGDNGENSPFLQAWRRSRTKALDLLSERLEDPQATTIVMDDNFHLRSMRRQVVQQCQKHIATMSDAEMTCITKMNIDFGIVWVDTDVAQCLERNPDRPRPVPDRIIQQMALTFEPPEAGESYSMLHVLGTDPLEHNLQLVLDFIASLSRLPAPIDPAVEQARVAQARAVTRASIQHQLDLYLRVCVQAVAQTNKRLAGKANQCRKGLLPRFKGATSTTGDLQIAFCCEMEKHVPDRETLSALAEAIQEALAAKERDLQRESECN